MISNEKIKQVFNAIKENGIDAFNDEALAKLLSILNPLELETFYMKSLTEFSNISDCERLINSKPVVQMMVNKDLRRIRMSPIFALYLESLKNGNYKEYFKSLTVEELADLKKYVSYTGVRKEREISGVKKILKMLTQEIRVREANKKPLFA